MDERGKAFGCIFCETGHEQELCDLITYKCPDVIVHPAAYVRHRTFMGVHTRETKVFIPGYVFFMCEDDLFIPQEFPRDRIYKILKNEFGDWRLISGDAEFASMLMRYDGTLPFSKAYIEDGWVYPIAGPLKDMEEYVRRIDPRNRSGLIAIRFNGREFRAWLGYDVIDKPPGTISPPHKLRKRDIERMEEEAAEEKLREAEEQGVPEQKTAVESLDAEKMPEGEENAAQSLETAQVPEGTDDGT